MYDNILHKPLRLRTNISPTARAILEGVKQIFFSCLRYCATLYSFVSPNSPSLSLFSFSSSFKLLVLLDLLSLLLLLSSSLLLLLLLLLVVVVVVRNNYWYLTINMLNFVKVEFSVGKVYILTSVLQYSRMSLVILSCRQSPIVSSSSLALAERQNKEDGQWRERLCK